jgi:DNA-binding response OmpR family regulator
MDDTPTVLIVDDEEDVVDIYELSLSREYDVRTAYDGTEALQQVDETVNAVLLDRRMPGLSGDEVLAEIRSRGIDVRVAMVTAVDPDFDVVEMGFDAYLTKPVGDDELHETVEELLELAAYDDRSKELFAIAEKMALLETRKAKAELAGSDEYERLERRRAELEAQDTEMDAEGFRKAFSGLSGGNVDDDES